MQVNVRQCYAGNDLMLFELTMPCGSMERLRGEDWTRNIASIALDMLEALYGARRSSVKFKHH